MRLRTAVHSLVLSFLLVPLAIWHVALPLEPAPSTIVVTDYGRGPRRSLRYSPTVGTRLDFEFEVHEQDKDGELPVNAITRVDRTGR